jgi:hypothetical protein
MQHHVRELDWNELERTLFTDGYALVPHVLDDRACNDVAEMYANDDFFRSRVHMEAHGFGRGQYRYFRYPLPDLIQSLREELYAGLAPIANRWMEALRLPDRFPIRSKRSSICAPRADKRARRRCLLTYEPGDWNALHQDLYGEIAFPFQATLFLSRPGEDFTGGEFVLVEQRPRAQSRPEVIVPELGSMLIFANRYRPVQGKNGTYRTIVRHGVSRIKSGRRYALGIIFHDAK